MDKNKKDARQHQEDVALNRGFLWVLAAIILEILLLLVNKYYINFRITAQGVAVAEVIHNVLKLGRWVCLVGLLFGLVWVFVKLWGKGKCEVLPAALTIGCAVLLVCFNVILTFETSGVRMLFLLIPAGAGLALLYYLYQREFFVSALAGGVSGIGLWLVRTSGARVLYTGVTILLLVLLAGIVLLLEKKSGAFQLKGHELRIFPVKTKYSLIYITCAAGIIAVAAAHFMGSSAAYYLIYTMVAWLFALLVYYTVKMM